MGFGGSGGGGSSSVAGSVDVALNNPVDSQVLSYDGAAAKWKNTNNAGASSGIVIVKWSGTSWGSYSTSSSVVRFFMSQNDATAIPPTYHSEFDLWYAHPDAE